MRLFVGIPMEGAAREALAGAISRLSRKLPSCRWVKASNVHLTVRFLGEVPEADLPVIEDWLRREVQPSELGSVQLEQTGWFEHRDRMVFWVGVRAGPWLQSLAKRLAGPVASVPEEPRPFVAHVTLARHRVGRRERAELGEFLRTFERLEFSDVPLQPARVALFESRPGGKDGPEYRELLSVGAGG